MDEAKSVCDRLNEKGHKCCVMSSRLSEEECDDSIKKFREDAINVIIATDFLSRGFDMPCIKLVINFDVPSLHYQELHLADYESYVHRVGRTGRYGRSGFALTLSDSEE
jgi:superfamily II DNA/RNA helicase